jgi:DNA-binding response OmpR family regulator
MANTNEPALQGDGLQVLLVEDEPALRELLCEVLTEAGFLVRQASDGKEALASLAYATVDVLVTDIFMPGIDGIEIIGHIRRGNPGTAIVAISGGGSYGVRRGADLVTPVMLRVLGAHEILQKPFRHEDLVVAVKAAFTRVLRPELPSPETAETANDPASKRRAARA